MLDRTRYERLLRVARPLDGAYPTSFSGVFEVESTAGEQLAVWLPGYSAQPGATLRAHEATDGLEGFGLGCSCLSKVGLRVSGHSTPLDAASSRPKRG